MIVNVSAVDAELDRIQRELTHSEVRTSLFNLVIFSPDATQAMANEALNEMLGKRAARVIHIVPGAEDESRLDVSARCFVDAEHKSVCFQEIVITSGTDGAGAAPGSWVPLLVRDIPTFILWLDRISDRATILRHACEQADKLLVDTRSAHLLGDSEQQMLETVRRLAVEDGIPVSDFAFRRLGPLQRIVALAFDNPRRTPLLERITTVQMAGGSHLSGRLFSLWLADRLEWTAGPGGFTDRRSETVVFEHLPGEDDGPVEVVVSFTGSDPVTIITHDAGCADVDCPDKESLHPVVSTASNGELLLEEVDVLAGSTLYRNALRKLPTE